MWLTIWLEERRWLRAVREARKIRARLGSTDQVRAFDIALRPPRARHAVVYPFAFYMLTPEDVLRARLAAETQGAIESEREH